MRKPVVVVALLLGVLAVLYLGWRNELMELIAAINRHPSPKGTATSNTTAATAATAAIETIQMSPAEVDIPETITDKHGRPSLPPTISSKSDYSLMPDFTADALWLYKSYNFATVLLWHASTGTLEQFNYPDPKRTLVYGKSPTLFAIPAGLILQGGQYHFADNVYTDHARIVLLTRNSQVVVGRLNTPRESPAFLPLSDGSLLIVGGIMKRQKHGGTEQITRTNAVEHLTYMDNKLTVVQLPDLPGEIRRDVSLVQRADGSIIAAGGSTSPYKGSNPMSSETYILDMVNKSWRSGPPLTEPRAAAVSLLLPDGSVMVTGGWTPSQTWQEEASRTSELLASGSNTFTPGPLLPIGIASPVTTSVEDGLKNRHLFLLGGITKAHESSHEVHEYNHSTREWHTVADGCTTYGDYSNPPDYLFSVANGHNLYLWCYNPNPSEGFNNGWQFLTPRLHEVATDEPGRNVPNAGLALYRKGVAFTPQHGNSPALLAGGYVDSAPTAAVDAISTSGQITPIANLNVARGDAQLFRLQDGSLLIGGGTRGRVGDRANNPIHSLEWLPAGEPLDKAHWRLLDITPPYGTTIAQMRSGKLLSVQTDGAVNLLSFSPTTTGTLQMTTTPLPPPTRAHIRTEDSDPIKIKEVLDGRIIVAGGAVQPQRIALLQENSLDSQAEDEYVYIGMPVNARSYEIYTPRTDSWSESAPSRLAKGSTAILDDGRVIKYGELYDEPSNTEETPIWHGVYLEASTPDGSTWQEWPALPEVAIKDANLFVIEGELFISGNRLRDRENSAPSLLQWFDVSSKQWSTIWEAAAEDPWRKHVGRVVVRQLANGKRIALPVAGY